MYSVLTLEKRCVYEGFTNNGGKLRNDLLKVN